MKGGLPWASAQGGGFWQWFTLSDPSMEEAFVDTPLYREFAKLEEFGHLPDESPILRFRHWLEKHKLAEQIFGVVKDILVERGLLLKPETVVDATLIAAPHRPKEQGSQTRPRGQQFAAWPGDGGIRGCGTPGN